MIIAGGAYEERVRTTGLWESLGGSAVRAAMALPSVERLVTATEAELAPILRGVGDTFGFEVVNAGRDRPVSFSYLAEFVEPVLLGRNAELSTELAIDGTAALVFGMVESGNRSIEVGQLVYDPQSTDDTGVNDLSSAVFERLVICANAEEVQSLGHGQSLEVSARTLLRRFGAEAVVVKAGARGCLVVDTDRAVWVGAVPSTGVRKLGTGDIFSASFAHAWTSGAPPIEAARIASFATSWWADRRVDHIRAEVLQQSYVDAHAAEELGNCGVQPRIYLAAPFFTIAELWLVQQCRAFLTAAGGVVFSPIDDVGLGGPEVAAEDLAGLRQSDAVFAILDGWDPGTLFEAGWANNSDIPLVGVGANLQEYRSSMLRGTGAEIYEDFTTGMYRAIWRGLGVGGDGHDE